MTSHRSMRQAARRSALDAQAALRKERADRERRLEGLAVAVLTALGERDGAVRDTERRAGEALRTMTAEEGLSLREAVEWCGSGRPYGAGGVSATATRARPARRKRPMSARHMHRLAIRTAIRAATLVGAPAAALCIQLDAVEDDAFTERAMLTA